MEKHEVEIEILPTGEVKIHVKGAKGKKCLSYVEFFKNMLGPVKEQQLTHEFYEPDSKVKIDLEAQQHVREAEG